MARPTAQQRKHSGTQGRRTQRNRVAQMKDAPTQFDMRENTASSRRHTSRNAMSTAPEPIGEAESLQNENSGIDPRMPILYVIELSLPYCNGAAESRRR